MAALTFLNYDVKLLNLKLKIFVGQTCPTASYHKKTYNKRFFIKI